jgi:exonuclease III
VGIKIISLNIEGDKHLAEVIGLIDKERPEAVCLQEIFEEDFNLLTKRFGMGGIFAPTVFIDKPGKPGFGKKGVFGIAMMGKLAGKFGSAYYFKRRTQELPKYGGKPNAGHRALVWQGIEGRRKIASTHFTWSKGGQTTEKQRRELNRLIKLLVNRVKPDILCGDFNAPRGAEIWSKLAEKFIDNIPPEVKTTLDPKLHYANGVELVVDGFFTDPKSKIKIDRLRLIGGVSDHLAIAAELVVKY